MHVLPAWLLLGLPWFVRRARFRWVDFALGGCMLGPHLPPPPTHHPTPPGFPATTDGWMGRWVGWTHSQQTWVVTHPPKFGWVLRGWFTLLPHTYTPCTHHLPPAMPPTTCHILHHHHYPGFTTTTTVYHHHLPPAFGINIAARHGFGSPATLPTTPTTTCLPPPACLPTTTATTA